MSARWLEPLARPLGVTLIAAAALSAAAPSAWAIPAFARKHNLACSSCHSAMPYLNSTGRAFKEAGWRMPDEDGIVDVDTEPAQEVSRSLWFERAFPLAGRVKSYPVDKVEGEDLKLRGLHEVELMAAGSFWKNGSFFLEVEGEDEEEFELVVAGEAGWHPHHAANVKAGYAPILHTDPYNSLQDGGNRLTVSNKVPLSVGGDVGARFRSDAQFVSFYGRTRPYGKGNSLYYSVGLSGGNDNPEGENPQDYLFRAAYDFTPDVTVGGFYFGGSRELGEQELDLRRWGVDLNLRLRDFYLLGLFMNAEEDFGTLPSEGEGSGGLSRVENTAGYVEAFYTVRRGGRPLFVPLIRFDWTELDGGGDTFSAITAQAGFYVTENAKVALEQYSELGVGPGEEKLNRTTLLVDVNF